MIAETCPACGHIHASNDARAVGLFTADGPRYVAANAGTPQRATRTEAETDECAWRQRRRRHQTSGAEVAAAGPVALPVRGDGPSAPEPDPEPIVFPAATMEAAARAKAWRDFLAQVHFSLMVWQLDDDVRGGCEDVLAWIRRCRDDLAFGTTP